METVRFLVHYGGVLTGEIHYEPGMVGEFDENICEALIRDGRAEDASVAAPGPMSEPTPSFAPISSEEAAFVDEKVAELSDRPEVPVEPEAPPATAEPEKPKKKRGRFGKAK